MPPSSSGATTGRPSDLPSWKSSAPQPGAMWTMPVPSSSPTSVQAHDAVLVRACRDRPGTPSGRRQVVERAGVAPADQVGAADLLEDLERPVERGLERPLRQPELVVALPDPDVAERRPDGRGHVRGQRPRRRRPDEQRLARPVEQREADRQPGVVAVLVALGHLRLGDAGPAARAPRHRVVALVDPAAPVALGEEAPDQVVVLVAEREVAAADVGHAEPPDEHLDRVGDRAVRTLDRGDRRRIGAEQVAQPAQLVRVVPVHPHPEPDRLLGLARGVGQDALLAQRHELGDAERLDVALGREAEVALDVDLDPQALAVEPVLPALVLAEHGVEALEEVLVGAAPGVVDAHRVVGRDRAVEEAPVRPAGVLGAQPGEGPPLAPGVEDLVLLGDEIGLRADGSEHSASGSGWVDSREVGPESSGRTACCPFRRVRVSYPRCTNLRAHDRAGGRRSRRRSSPCSSPASASCTPARRCAPWPSPPARSCSSPSGAGMVLRVDRIALLGFLIDPTVLDAVFVVNLGVLLYRLVAIVDAYRVAEYLNGAAASGRRPGRPRRGSAGTRCRSRACSRSSWS